MISFKLLTNLSTGHNPNSDSSGQYLSGERGTGPSFTITRIWSPGTEGHDKTGHARARVFGQRFVRGVGDETWVWLTLELDVGTEWCELVSDEGPVLGYVIVWKRTGRGEGRKVESGQYCVVRF